MWPFKSRSNIDPEMAKYVNQQGIELLQKAMDTGNIPEPMGLQQAYIGIVICQLRASSPDEMTRHISKCTDLVAKRNGFILSLVPPYIFTAYGLRPGTSDTGDISALTQKLAEYLVSELADSIRIVFTTSDGYVGTIGSSTYQSYGPVVPNINKVFEALPAVGYGQFLKIEL